MLSHQGSERGLGGVGGATTQRPQQFAKPPISEDRSRTVHASAAPIIRGAGGWGSVLPRSKLSEFALKFLHLMMIDSLSDIVLCTSFN